MWKDEIVEEVRRERERISARFDHDLDRLFRALQEEERQSGREVVSFPARKAKPVGSRSG